LPTATLSFGGAIEGKSCQKAPPLPPEAADDVDAADDELDVSVDAAAGD
jgi:hypothetical protein